ncbi:MAG: helix-turn-helix domain-containing protein [Bacteroidales bacterium]|nr:helix-turn-helix domain-containing protein [Bacteroidales bacterium]
MTEILEQIKMKPDESFFIGVFQDTIDKSIWHYHQEYELSFITEGTGKRIVGDSIEEFYPGDLIFIGPRLPHVWIPENPEINFSSGRTLESVYMLFNETIVPPPLISLPEFTQVRKAMLLSERGIKITGDTLMEVSEIMLQLPYLDKFTRLINFYRIMKIIGGSNSLEMLASEDYMKTRFESKNERIIKIHEYLMKNYREDIDLNSIAGLVNMAPGSVCRFFKTLTGTTIFEYVNKIKTDYACKMLMNTDLHITDISYDCGFNNLSHFNKQFKNHCGKTPTEFRKQFEKL